VLSATRQICAGYPSEPEPPWLTRWAMEASLQVPAEIKNNVVFLGVMEGDHFKPKATGFFVGYEGKYGDLLHLVTAEHVIAGLRLKGHTHLYVRTHIPGFPLSQISLQNWYFHPGAERRPTDVALTPVILKGTKPSDILVLDPRSFVTPQNIVQREWGVGDEIVVVGLFRNHYGHTKNIPVVRIGSLAALPEEPVKTKWGFIDAYLVELHSIGGLSGSPVYIQHPPFRVGHDGTPHVVTGGRINLLGIMQGHFDIPNLREDSAMDDDDQDGSGSINTGIGVVVPAHKIMETLEHPDLKTARAVLDAKMEKGAASLDLADESGPPASDANPNHREDFTRLVGAAARKREPED
jgi:hypothetical protein